MSAHSASIDELLLPGPVVEGHAKIESECTKCHKKFDKGAQPALCSDCHKDVAKDFKEKRGYHGRLEEEKPCKGCHTEHKGRNAGIAIFSQDKFDHSKTDFQLKGGHLNEKVQCKNCHREKTKYRDAPSECNGCHKKDDKHKGKLGADCASCHVEKEWKATTFDHDKSHFKLLGKHSDVKCKSCHIGDEYKDTPKQCSACHKKDDQEKGHKGKLGEKCETCHSEKEWKSNAFSHDTDTKFALRDKHKSAKCDACHKGGISGKNADLSIKLEKACVACHKKDDQEKGHKGALGGKCEACHTEKEWKASTFDHDTDTKFPLRDKHKSAKCDTCHKGGISGKNADFSIKLERVCVACHKKDDQEKGHKGGMGGKCETCHTEKDWKASIFAHDKDTKFPLRDKHKSAKCDACHKGVISGGKVDLKLGKECFTCHKKEDQEKGHKGKLGEKCETCHIEKDWKASTFDHDKDTKFPLRDKHKSAKCDACHKGATSGNRADLKLDKECFSCHEKDDKHKEQLGIKCDRCHNEKLWQKSLYDHAKARFLLTGTHLKIECKKCHLTPTSFDLPSACYGCHEKTDVHKKRFGTECANCHYADGWKNLKYRHDQTKFKQDGMHKKVKCVECHRGQSESEYSTPRACVDCHSKKDIHRGSFGQVCDRCHYTSGWAEINRGGLIK